MEYKVKFKFEKEFKDYYKDISLEGECPGEIKVPFLTLRYSNAHSEKSNN